MSGRASRHFLGGLTLRGRIGAAFAVAALVITVIVGGVIALASNSEMRGRVGQSLATDAGRLAERLDAELAARRRQLALLAALDPLRQLNDGAARPAAAPPLPGPSGAQRVRAMLDELRRDDPDWRWIGVADATGAVVAATGAMPVGTDLSRRASVQASLHGRATAGLASGSSDDRPSVDVAVPIRDADGRVSGVVVAQLGWEGLQRLAVAVPSADDDGVTRREAYVVAGGDRILIGPAGATGQRLALASLARARAGFVGWMAEDSSDGQFLTGSAVAAGDGQARAPGAPDPRWIVLVRERRDDAYAPAEALGQEVFVLGSGLAAFFAIIGWFIAGWFTTPLERIAQAAERLRQGDDVELPRIRGTIEIESLSTTLRALVATLTRKQLALDEMAEIARHDPLTGLLNRHGLRMRLGAEMREPRAREAALMLFVADLDGFKAVNDTHGHAVGDQLLRLVGARLRAAVRPSDVVARLGGDEFVLAVRAPEGRHDAAAIDIAHRVLGSLGAPYDIAGRAVSVGCSLGGACWPDHAPPGVDGRPSVDVVLEMADMALYEVKRGGKGRLLIHGERLTHA